MILATNDKERIRKKLICFAHLVADHSSRRGRFSIPHVQDEERTMLPILTRPEKKNAWKWLTRLKISHVLSFQYGMACIHLRTWTSSAHILPRFLRKETNSSSTVVVLVQYMRKHLCVLSAYSSRGHHVRCGSGTEPSIALEGRDETARAVRVLLTGSAARARAGRPRRAELIDGAVAVALAVAETEDGAVAVVVDSVDVSVAVAVAAAAARALLAEGCIGITARRRDHD